MPEPNTKALNPHRSLTPDKVVELFAERLPDLVPGLAADRDWIWWSGEKPAESDRALLLTLGFSFTRRPHELSDGRVAHWYHPCGGDVFRRHRKVGSSYQHKRARRNPASPAESIVNHYEADSNLAQLAAGLGVDAE